MHQLSDNLTATSFRPRCRCRTPLAGLLFLCATVGMSLANAGTLRAAIVNGDFETGDLSGWTVTSGSVQVVDDNGPMFGVLEGTFAAWIDAYASDWVTIGPSSMRQTFTAGVGDTLRFLYAALHSDSEFDPFFQAGSGQQSVSLLRPGGTTQTIVSGSGSHGWFEAVVPIQIAGDYTLIATATSQLFSSGLGGLHVVELYLDAVELEQLSTEGAPILPTTTNPGTPEVPPVFFFTGVPSGQWFDPPLAAGYTYEMTSDSLFTKILDFPTGFDDLFTVSVDGNVLGEFGPGQSVDFTGFAGGGVSRFQISGLNPGTDPEDPNAFPLKLLFDTNQADFTMQAILAVPEPASLSLAVLGLAGCWIMRRRPRRPGLDYEERMRQPAPLEFCRLVSLSIRFSRK